MSPTVSMLITLLVPLRTSALVCAYGRWPLRIRVLASAIVRLSVDSFSVPSCSSFYLAS